MLDLKRLSYMLHNNIYGFNLYTPDTHMAYLAVFLLFAQPISF